MIIYDKSKWWKIQMSYKGTVVGSMLPRLIGYTLFTAMLAILQANGYKIPAVNSTVHTLLGTALGLLLVFRTNAQYDRYWEGRKLLGGITNTNRNLYRAASSYCPSNSAALVQYMGGYCVGLKHRLRGVKDNTEFEVIKDPAEREKIASLPSPASASLAFMSMWIENEVKKGSMERWQARAIEGYVGVLEDNKGGLERIAATPVPFAYAAQTHQFLALYMLTLPFTMVFTYGYYAIVAVFMITFGLVGIDEAGIEIEDPFGLDPNDLDLEGLFGAAMINAKALAEINTYTDGANMRVSMADIAKDDPLLSSQSGEQLLKK